MAFRAEPRLSRMMFALSPARADPMIGLSPSSGWGLGGLSQFEPCAGLSQPCFGLFDHHDLRPGWLRRNARRSGPSAALPSGPLIFSQAIQFQGGMAKHNFVWTGICRTWQYGLLVQALLLSVLRSARADPLLGRLLHSRRALLGLRPPVGLGSPLELEPCLG